MLPLCTTEEDDMETRRGRLISEIAEGQGMVNNTPCPPNNALELTVRPMTFSSLSKPGCGCPDGHPPSLDASFVATRQLIAGR